MMDSCQLLSHRVVRRPLPFVLHCSHVRVGTLADRTLVDCSSGVVDRSQVAVGHRPVVEGRPGPHLRPCHPVHTRPAFPD